MSGSLEARPINVTGVCRTIYETGNRIEYKPETSRSLSFGIDYSPTAAPTLRISAGYYDIRYEDRIGSLPTSGEVLDHGAEFPDIARADPSEALVESFLSRCAQSINCLNLVGPVDPTAVDYYLDLRTTNLATTRARGLDAYVGYSWETGGGVWRANLHGTHALELESRLSAISNPFSGIDRVGFPAATNTIERSVGHAGPRLSRQCGLWSAAQLSRYAPRTLLPSSQVTNGKSTH